MLISSKLKWEFINTLFKTACIGLLRNKLYICNSIYSTSLFSQSQSGLQPDQPPAVKRLRLSDFFFVFFHTMVIPCLKYLQPQSLALAFFCFCLADEGARPLRLYFYSPEEPFRACSFVTFVFNVLLKCFLLYALTTMNCMRFEML